MTETQDGFWNEERLRTLLRILPDGIFTVDMSGRVTSWNPAMERMTGIAASEAIGRPCSQLACEQCPGGPPHCGVFQMGAVEAAECTLRRADGSVVHVLKNACVMRDEQGQPIAALEALTDVTSLKVARDQVAQVMESLRKSHGFSGLIGKNHRMQELYGLIRQAAASNATVLLTGESGTGKELVAAAIHFNSARKERPFVKVNCSALTETLLESELFGHARGSFTGAVNDKVGRFEAADGGTILLDEIGDASALIQLKLLRVLQEKEFERVGETRTRRVDVRVVAATNKDLRQLMRDGVFREDLFYRLKVFPLNLPPLRERKDDIPLLAGHFIEKFNKETGKSIKGLSHDSMRALMDYCWPGNVRELENAIEHAFVTCEGEEIGLFDLPQEVRRAEFRSSLCAGGARSAASSAGEDRESLLRLLNECRWNKAEVARRLNISRTAVWKRMKKLGIALNGEG